MNVCVSRFAIIYILLFYQFMCGLDKSKSLFKRYTFLVFNWASRHLVPIVSFTVLIIGAIQLTIDDADLIQLNTRQ